MLDMAAQLQDQNNEQARARAALASQPQTHEDFDGEHCLVCFDDMPAARLAAGRIRCVVCETKIEKSNKLRGR